jgi:uncharacterized protein
MKTICPRCGHETSFEGNPFRPFCGERCKLMDLGNWMMESYRLQSTLGESDEEPLLSSPPESEVP